MVIEELVEALAVEGVVTSRALVEQLIGAYVDDGDVVVVARVLLLKPWVGVLTVELFVMTPER